VGALAPSAPLVPLPMGSCEHKCATVANLIDLPKKVREYMILILDKDKHFILSISN